MPNLKGTMLFEMNTVPNYAGQRVRTGGWSESWFFAGSTKTAVKGQLDTLALARSALMPGTASIVGYRIQQVDPVGASQSYVVNFPGIAGATDAPQMALLLRASTSDGTNNKNIILRCVPDNVIVGGEYAPTNFYDARIAQFRAVLLTGYGWRGRNRSYPVQQFVKIDATGVAQFATPHGYTPGMKLRLYKARGIQGRALKGAFVVTDPITTTTLTLGQWLNVIASSGGVRRDDVTYPTLGGGTVTFLRSVVKKVGRPFDLYRGRAPVKR